MSNNQRAFSLIEIIIVIAILGFLATVTIASFKPQEIFANSRNAKRVSDINAVNTAISQWLAREGSNDEDPYGTLGLTPDGIQPITPADGIITTEGIAVTSLNAISDPAYLQSLPCDPDGVADYRVGVNNIDKPSRILVCTDKIEFTSTYSQSEYPAGIFCLSN